MAEAKRPKFVKPASIDEAAAKAYLEFAHPDNLLQLKQEHVDAVHEKYTNFKGFLEGLRSDGKLPEFGNALKDDNLAKDILAEYVALAVDGVVPDHGIYKHFKQHKFKDSDARLHYVLNEAGRLMGLGFKDDQLAQILGSIKENKDFASQLKGIIEGYVQKGNVGNHWGAKLYQQTFDRPEYMRPGVMTEWLAKQKGFKAYEWDGDEHTIYRAPELKRLVDKINAEEPLAKEELKELKIKKKPVSYEEAA